MAATLNLTNILNDEEERKLFAAQMNIRFNSIKNLMDALNLEVNSKDEETRAKTIFCAFKFIICLDQFVEEMKQVILELKECENPTLN